MKDGGHAFPGGKFGTEYGMTLRDYFAGQVLAGMLSKGRWNQNNEEIRSGEDWARAAYSIADDMLKERDR